MSILDVDYKEVSYSDYKEFQEQYYQLLAENKALKKKLKKLKYENCVLKNCNKEICNGKYN